MFADEGADMMDGCYWMYGWEWLGWVLSDERVLTVGEC